MLQPVIHVPGTEPLDRMPSIDDNSVVVAVVVKMSERLNAENVITVNVVYNVSKEATATFTFESMPATIVSTTVS